MKRRNPRLLNFQNIVGFQAIFLWILGVIFLNTFILLVTCNLMFSAVMFVMKLLGMDLDSEMSDVSGVRPQCTQSAKIRQQRDATMANIGR